MFPMNKIYLNLDFVLTLKTHRNGECYQFVQLCFLCKNMSILFLLEILHNSHIKYWWSFCVRSTVFFNTLGISDGSQTSTPIVDEHTPRSQVEDALSIGGYQGTKQKAWMYIAQSSFLSKRWNWYQVFWKDSRLLSDIDNFLLLKITETVHSNRRDRYLSSGRRCWPFMITCLVGSALCLLMEFLFI